MKALGTAFISLLGVFCVVIAPAAEDFTAHAWQMESKGEAAEARDYLQSAAQNGGVDAKLAYAEFLDRHRDPAARDAYEKVWDGSRGKQREFAARRLALLDLIAGDRDRAERHVEDYRTAGGRDFTFPQSAALAPEKRQTIAIPGPMRSFSAWRRWRQRCCPKRCSRRWRATSSRTVIRPPAPTVCSSRPNISSW